MNRKLSYQLVSILGIILLSSTLLLSSAHSYTANATSLSSVSASVYYTDTFDTDTRTNYTNAYNSNNSSTFSWDETNEWVYITTTGWNGADWRTDLIPVAKEYRIDFNVSAFNGQSRVQVFPKGTSFSGGNENYVYMFFYDDRVEYGKVINGIGSTYTTTYDFQPNIWYTSRLIQNGTSYNFYLGSTLLGTQVFTDTVLNEPMYMAFGSEQPSGSATYYRFDNLYVSPTFGTVFTYQGFIKKDSNPAVGPCDFQFSLYDAYSGGTQIGSTIASVDTTVSNGLFTVQLDFGSGVFTGDARYLEIAVRCPAGSGSYTTLSPRQELTPAPYSLYSSSTGALQTYPIANTAPSAGQILKWDGSQWAPSSEGATSSWNLTGNSGTVPGTNFLGTTDNQAFELKVNNSRAFRVEPNSTSPNMIGGYSGNNATSGVVGATVSGGGASGSTNRVTDDYGTVGGGTNNLAGDNAGTTSDMAGATICGGQVNVASNSLATVGGGYNNTASGSGATVGGGTGNTASKSVATIGGGLSNQATGYYSTIGGGDSNKAGNYGTVPGGYHNEATGDYSFAAGMNARANNQGCFVWADNTGSNVTCDNDYRWISRASGGVYFYTNSTSTSGVYVAAGGNSWSSVSDYNLKENFASVDVQNLLARLSEIPITTWNYKSQDTSIRHIGPMAQDFYAAFGVGEDDRHITTIDTDGVALAAIQGLYQTVQEQDGLITAQQHEIDALKQQNTDLEARIETIEKMLGKNPPAGFNITPGWFVVGGLTVIGLIFGGRKWLLIGGQ